MTVGQRTWTQVPFDDVCVGLLRAGGIGGHDVFPPQPAVAVPADPEGRYRELVNRAWPFLRFVPPCDWFRVPILSAADLAEMAVIAEESWFPEPGRADRMVHAVAVAIDPATPHGRRVLAWETSLRAADLDRQVTMFGHGPSGPFSVLDGNHRLVAAARRASRGDTTLFAFEVHVGLSFGPCRWHGDPVTWEERPAAAGERRFVLRVW